MQLFSGYAGALLLAAAKALCRFEFGLWVSGFWTWGLGFFFRYSGSPESEGYDDGKFPAKHWSYGQCRLSVAAEAVEGESEGRVSEAVDSAPGVPEVPAQSEEALEEVGELASEEVAAMRRRAERESGNKVMERAAMDKRVAEFRQGEEERARSHEERMAARRAAEAAADAYGGSGESLQGIMSWAKWSVTS